MADEEIDLYGDLEDYDVAEQLKKTEKICSDLQEKLRECEEQQLLKDNEFQILNTDFRNMNANLNSLFQTAKIEIQRKDNQIRDLRKELDNMRFRRDRRMQNEKNSQLRHIATQTDMLNEPKILQENQMKIEDVLKKAKDRAEHLNENERHPRNPFSSGRNEFLHVNCNRNKEDLKDKNSSDLSRDKNSRGRHWQTDDTHRSRQKHQRTVDRQSSERKKRHRSRSISTERKRSRRSKSKQRDRSTNRFSERHLPEKNAYKESYRTGVRSNEHKKRSPENTSKGDLRDTTQRRLRKKEENHSEHSEHKTENGRVGHSEKYMLEVDEKIPKLNVEEKPTLKAYKQVSNVFETEENKAENRISPPRDKAKKYENLEDGEIIDENSLESSSAQPVINIKVEQSNSGSTPKDLMITANEKKHPCQLVEGRNIEIDVKYNHERILIHDNISTEENFSKTKSNLDSEVNILEVNCMKSIASENVSELPEIDLPITIDNLSTNKPNVDKMEHFPDSCSSLDKNDEVCEKTSLDTSGLLDTSKVVKNISTSSTNYTLVEDDENNDVIIYVSRKKRKKKKNLENSIAQD